MDKLYGYAGDDIFYADEEDTVIDGGVGNDVVDYRDSDVAINWTSVNAQVSSVEKVIGSNFDDVLELPASIAGIIFDSDVTIDGGRGDDIVSGNDAVVRFETY